MIWTREDELALAACRECISNCQRRHLTPAPYFATAVKMFEALEAAGMIERGEETAPKDLCDGCVEHVYGGCRKGYQMATLSLSGREVVKCGFRRSTEDARQTTAYKGRSEHRAETAGKARQKEAAKWNGK